MLLTFVSSGDGDGGGDGGGQGKDDRGGPRRRRG